MTVGQRVLAIHPKTGELKTGSILTSEGIRFNIRFDNPELGIVLIKDYNLIPIGDSIFMIKYAKIIEIEQNQNNQENEIKSGSYLARQRCIFFNKM